MCLTVCLAAVSCDPGAIALVTPGTGSASVTRHAVVVRVVVDRADEALAASLGWAAGVPGATVHWLRNGTAEWKQAATDESGVALFPGLPAGLYRLYASRLLTEEETGLVGGALRALGDGQTVYLSGTDTLTLALLADRPGELLISEIGTGTAVPWETGGNGYGDNLYFEIYNNGPANVYLDSLVFGVAYAIGSRETAHTPCTVSAAVREDAAGLHARAMLQFPGDGDDHVVSPGEARVVAMAAIDHRPVHPLLPDLSGADFEIAPSGGADNPQAPNLIDVGLEPWTDNNLLDGYRIFFLSRPLDIGGLPLLFRDPQGRGYIRVPREALIDVVATASLWPESNLEAPPCYPIVHRDFERYEGGFVHIGFDVDHAYSTVRGVQRRALRRAPDGRVVLFNTNTSAVDFVWDVKTPGWVPPPEK